MADRGKVIRGMEACIKGDCRENACPYALENECRKSLERDALELLKAQEPSAPAVPLGPLCKWLAGYAAPPNYALQEVINEHEIQPKLPNYHVEAWKLHFMELLKSGLMDTEGENE